MRLQSDYAILDVKRGRGVLLKQVAEKGPVRVVIYGTVEGGFGHDDGTSREFNVDVDRVEVMED